MTQNNNPKTVDQSLFRVIFAEYPSAGGNECGTLYLFDFFNELKNETVGSYSFFGNYYYLLPCRYPHIFLEKNEDEIRSLTVEEELPQKYENDKRLIFPACMPRNPISEADRMQLYRYTGELNSIKGHYTEELGNITEFDISELWGVNCRVFYVGSIDVARVDGIEAVGMPIGLFHKDIAADEYEPVILAAKVTIKTDNEAL